MTVTIELDWDEVTALMFMLHRKVKWRHDYAGREQHVQSLEAKLKRAIEGPVA